jgi:hypothetical protein
MFARIIGIDYSGAQTPTSSLKGLRVYLAEGAKLPFEVLPPPSPRQLIGKDETALREYDDAGAENVERWRRKLLGLDRLLDCHDKKMIH